MSPLHVAPNGCYFETLHGDPFLFIGANDAITWPGLSGLYRRRDLPSARAHLENMASHGVNVLRLMLEYAHVDGRYFERPAGKFNPAMVRLWDDLFEMCEELGLRVLLAPWDNFWMTRRWHKHPYNRLNGGPAESQQSFFTDEATIEAIENRLRFVARRWGSVVCAWDLFNEIHTHWGGTPESQMPVLARWSQAIRDEEASAWGWTRPQSVSVFGPEPNVQGEGYHEMIFAHPSLDFSTTHIYHSDAIDHPRDTVAPALSMARWTRFGLEHAGPQRPFLDTEHGPIALFNNERKYLPEDFDDEYERHMMWAHLVSGGAGSGMRWPARHPHILTPGMLRALKSVSAFLLLVDWKNFRPRPAEGDVSARAEDGSQNGSGMHVFASRDEHQAVAWLLRDNAGEPGVLPAREPQKVSLELRGMQLGNYTARAWSTVSGRETGCWQARVDGQGVLRFEVQMENDVALAIATQS